MNDYYGLNLFTKAALVSFFVLAIVFMVVGTIFGEQGPGRVLFAEEELVKEETKPMVTGKGNLMVAGKKGFSFFNIAIPSRPILVSRLLDFEINDFIVLKERVIAVGDGQLFIINTASPRPQLVSSFDLPCHQLNNIVVNKEKAYITCAGEQPALMIVNIKNSTAPLLLSTIKLDKIVRQIVFTDKGQAFFLLEGAEVQLWDLTNDLSPQKKSEMTVDEPQVMHVISQ
jgi:hypothetical protein